MILHLRVGIVTYVYITLSTFDYSKTGFTHFSVILFSQSNIISTGDSHAPKVRICFFFFFKDILIYWAIIIYLKNLPKGEILALECI